MRDEILFLVFIAYIWVTGFVVGWVTRANRR